MNQSLYEKVLDRSEMTSVASYRCEECDTVFDSQQEIIQHESMQDIEDQVFAGSDINITKTKIE